ncbi:MAG: hypothetical protein M1542_04045 [Thermotogae bacterium]|jgi:hypothetical protein|nr:hypothetical protein [Thermotogota bacterium]
MKESSKAKLILDKDYQIGKMDKRMNYQTEGHTQNMYGGDRSTGTCQSRNLGSKIVLVYQR